MSTADDGGPAEQGAAPRAAGERPRVVLYSRAGCHLCDDARAIVVAVCEAHGERWSEVDIDRPDGAAHPHADLVAELGELVPVVEVDGVRQGYWRIDAQRLRRVLAAGAPTP